MAECHGRQKRSAVQPPGAVGGAEVGQSSSAQSDSPALSGSLSLDEGGAAQRHRPGSDSPQDARTLAQGPPGVVTCTDNEFARAVEPMIINRGISTLLIGLVRIYQWTISPLLGPCCRFTPSCSQYFILAVEKY